MEDRSKRDALVEEHIGLVRAIALNLQTTLPAHIPIDDLIGTGQLGLLEAAARFDPAHGISFSAYAKHRIRGAMLDGLRRVDWATRSARRYIRAVDALRAAQPDGWQAEAAALAEEMGIGSERAAEMLNQGPDVPLEMQLDGEEDHMVRELKADPSTYADAAYSRNELATTLRAVMDSNLPPRYQMVVEMYYAGEMTMREIGDSLDIQESRVSQIHANALGKLRAAFETMGVRATDFAHA